ncbi:hypothetical protein IE81DRAFT_323340, partial [Ceraceosorus guamensis]
MAWFSNQWSRLQNAVNDTFDPIGDGTFSPHAQHNDPGQASASGIAGGSSGRTPFGRANSGTTDGAPIKHINVAWGKQRLSINLPPSPPPTLGILKAHIATQTFVPYDNIKLISSGFILRDDRAALTSFGLKDGSKLTLVGSTDGPPPIGDRPGGKAPPPPPPKEEQEPESESSLISRIETILNGVRRDLGPDIEAFCAGSQPPTSPAESRSKTQKRLSELLLRALLALDSVAVTGEESRLKRKEAVKEVQS